jgi:hypothetical protein
LSVFWFKSVENSRKQKRQLHLEVLHYVTKRENRRINSITWERSKIKSWNFHTRFLRLLDTLFKKQLLSRATLNDSGSESTTFSELLRKNIFFFFKNFTSKRCILVIFINFEDKLLLWTILDESGSKFTSLNFLLVKTWNFLIFYHFWAEI